MKIKGKIKSDIKVKGSGENLKGIRNVGERVNVIKKWVQFY